MENINVLINGMVSKIETSTHFPQAAIVGLEKRSKKITQKETSFFFCIKQKSNFLISMQAPSVLGWQ